MRVTPHLATGITVGYLVARAFHPSLEAEVLAPCVGLLFAVLPDVDLPNSTVSKSLHVNHLGRTIQDGQYAWRFGRRILGLEVWHRGAFHSYAFALLAGLGAWWITSSLMWAGVVSLSYLSHLLLDGFNKAPQRLHYPSRKMKWLPFPHFAQSSVSGKTIEILTEISCIVLVAATIKNFL